VMTSWVLWQECIGRSASYKHPLPCLKREEPEKKKHPSERGDASRKKLLFCWLSCGVHDKGEEVLLREGPLKAC